MDPLADVGGYDEECHYSAITMHSNDSYESMKIWTVGVPAASGIAWATSLLGIMCPGQYVAASERRASYLAGYITQCWEWY
jgi:hypothetical protein